MQICIVEVMVFVSGDDQVDQFEAPTTVLMRARVAIVDTLQASLDR